MPRRTAHRAVRTRRAAFLVGDMCALPVARRLVRHRHHRLRPAQRARSAAGRPRDRARAAAGRPVPLARLQSARPILSCAQRITRICRPWAARSGGRCTAIPIRTATSPSRSAPTRVRPRSSICCGRTDFTAARWRRVLGGLMAIHEATRQSSRRPYPLTVDRNRRRQNAGSFDATHRRDSASSSCTWSGPRPTLRRGQTTARGTDRATLVRKSSKLSSVNAGMASPEARMCSSLNRSRPRVRFTRATTTGTGAGCIDREFDVIVCRRSEAEPRGARRREHAEPVAFRFQYLRHLLQHRHDRRAEAAASHACVASWFAALRAAAAFCACSMLSRTRLRTSDISMRGSLSNRSRHTAADRPQPCDLSRHPDPDRRPARRSCAGPESAAAG